jgi:hypothetical protein
VECADQQRPPVRREGQYVRHHASIGEHPRRLTGRVDETLVEATLVIQPVDQGNETRPAEACRARQQDRRWLWFIVPLNVVATIAVPVWLAASLAGYSSYRYFATNYSTAGTAYTAGLSYDGSEVQNVYPFDEQGRPLTGVRLYTETGTPLELTPNDCASQYDKAVSGNVFPQMTIVGDSGATNPEDCQESDKPGFKVLPPLAATTTAPTSPTPSSPATPSPGAGKPVTPTAKPSSTPSAPQATATEPEVTLTIRPLR